MDVQQYKSLTQQQLRSLNSKCGTLLLLDVPQGLQFGIDNITWKTGTKFKGIKFIPLGAHIISYSLQQQNHQFKINKFLHFDHSKGLQTQIIIMKWSFKYTMFLELKGADAQGYRQGVRNYHFDSYLGPYLLANLQFWRENSSFVTRKVLDKLEPVEKIYKFEEEYQKIKEKKQQQVRVDVDEEDEEQEVIEENQIDDEGEDQGIRPQNKDKMMDEKQPTTVKQQAPVSQYINKKFQALSDTIYYSQIPRLLTTDPIHISKVNLNKTQLLIEVISKEYLFSGQHKDHKPDEQHVFGILGQIQYAFIYFLIGQDLDSLQQWKKLVNLLVFSQDLFETREMTQLKRQQLTKGNKSLNPLINSFQKLSLEFVVVLYNQIKQFPADFFMDQLSKNSFMETCLKRMHEYLRDTEGTISKKVKKRIQKLFKLLSNKFNYEPKTQDLSDYAHDQDAPIVVPQLETYF